MRQTTIYSEKGADIVSGEGFLSAKLANGYLDWFAPHCPDSCAQQEDLPRESERDRIGKVRGLCFWIDRPRTRELGTNSLPCLTPAPALPASYSSAPMY